MSERGVGRLVARAARPAISARSTSWAPAATAVAVPVAPPVPNPSPVPVPVLGSRGPAPEAPFAPATPAPCDTCRAGSGRRHVLPALAAPEAGPALRHGRARRDNCAAGAESGCAAPAPPLPRRAPPLSDPLNPLRRAATRRERSSRWALCRPRRSGPCPHLTRIPGRPDDGDRRSRLHHPSSSARSR